MLGRMGEFSDRMLCNAAIELAYLDLLHGSRKS